MELYKFCACLFGKLHYVIYKFYKISFLDT